MSEKAEGLDTWEVIIWIALGFLVGAVFAAKYVKSGGYDYDESLPAGVGIIMVVMGFGPALFFWAIGMQMRKAVLEEKITVATYWTTVFGVAVSVFTLLGITGVDDIFNLWDSV